MPKTTIKPKIAELPALVGTVQVGQIVLYYHSESDGHRNNTTKSAALVTNVFDGGVLNLHVFFDGQNDEPRGSISYRTKAEPGSQFWDFN